MVWHKMRKVNNLGKAHADDSLGGSIALPLNMVLSKESTGSWYDGPVPRY